MIKYLILLVRSIIVYFINYIRNPLKKFQTHIFIIIIISLYFSILLYSIAESQIKIPFFQKNPVFLSELAFIFNVKVLKIKELRNENICAHFGSFRKSIIVKADSAKINWM